MAKLHWKEALAQRNALRSFMNPPRSEHGVVLPALAFERAAERLFPPPANFDPVQWAADRGIFLWSKQKEYLNSVRDNRYTAVKSCHDAGKSFASAVLIVAWADTYGDDGFVVWTAPTYSQVNAIIGREIRDLIERLGLDNLELLGDNTLKYKGRLRGYGRKPADHDQAAFQGIHAKHVLVVIDEACGVPKSLFVAADALATNEMARVAAIGNPDDPSAEFEVVCRPGSGWTVIRINGLETPNFTEEWVPDYMRPLLLGRDWVEERVKRWGKNSPLYTSKVLGDFPEVSIDTLIAPALIRAAWDNELPGTVQGCLGVDVARYGDDESMAYRNRGGVIREEWKGYKTSTMETVGHIAKLLDRWKGWLPCVVDTIGVGAGVADRLSELGYDVVQFNAAAAASEPTRFKNARAEAYWIFRELMEEGLIDLDPADEDLANELQAIHWSIDSGGRIQIEKKDDIRKRIGRSPDRADAAVMSVYNGLMADRVESDHDEVLAYKGRSITGDLLGRDW